MKSKLGVLGHEDRGISVDSSPMVTILRQHVKRPENYSVKPSIIDRSDLHPQNGGERAASVAAAVEGASAASVGLTAAAAAAAVAAVEASAAAHRK